MPFLLLLENMQLILNFVFVFLLLLMLLLDLACDLKEHISEFLHLRNKIPIISHYSKLLNPLEEKWFVSGHKS